MDNLQRRLQDVNISDNPQNEAPDEGPAFASESDRQFWAKQQEMRGKYLASLRKVVSVIQRMHERQPQSINALFMTHLQDSLSILNMHRSLPRPERLTLVVLQRAERFIVSVLASYQEYISSHPAEAAPQLENALAVDSEE